MDVLPRVLDLGIPTPVVVPGEAKDGVVAETGKHPTGAERGPVATRPMRPSLSGTASVPGAVVGGALGAGR